MKVGRRRQSENRVKVITTKVSANLLTTEKKSCQIKNNLDRKGTARNKWSMAQGGKRKASCRVLNCTTIFIHNTLPSMNQVLNPNATNWSTRPKLSRYRNVRINQLKLD